MKYVETYALSGEGYRKIFHSDGWRIAILNYTHELDIEAINWVECHQETDETFVLLEGECTLIFADVYNEKITDFSFIKMAPQHVYKVSRKAYHTHVLSTHAKVLLVENESTSDDNSKRIYLNEKDQIQLRDAYRNI